MRIFEVDSSLQDFAKHAKAWIRVVQRYAQINNTRDSESEGFSSSVKQKKCLVLPIPTPAVEGVVEMVGELVVDKEAAAEVLMLKFQGKHQRLELART